MKFLKLTLRTTILLFFIISPLILFSQNSPKEVEKVLENWAYFNQRNKLDKAIDQAKLAYDFAKKIERKDLMGEALYSEGLSLIKKKKRQNKNRKLAKEKFTESLLLATESNDTKRRIDNLKQLKWLAKEDKDDQRVAYYDNQINEINSLQEASVANQLLSTNNEKLADNNEQLVENVEKLEEKADELVFQKQFLSKKVKSLTEAQLESELLIALQKNQVDSLGFERTKDSFLLEAKELVLSEQGAKLELQKSHIELQESQLELQASQRNFFLALAAMIGLLAFGALMRYWETKKYNISLETKNEIIEEEKKRSEELLLNILPAMIATELKENGVAKARKYEQATVFFADFKNFSKIAESLSPEALVRELDLYFKVFDKIMRKYNLEKIKTIGDAYMCVGGLPEERTGHVKDIVTAALEIQSVLATMKIERKKKGLPFFEARIGIHTGPLVAGVVGSSKFAYDVWGDTVNVAARLESTSEAGKVNVSKSTYNKIKKDFDCEFRGKIAIKNRGEVDMYFVNGLNKKRA